MKYRVPFLQHGNGEAHGVIVQESEVPISLLEGWILPGGDWHYVLSTPMICGKSRRLQESFVVSSEFLDNANAKDTAEKLQEELDQAIGRLETIADDLGAEFLLEGLEFVESAAGGMEF